MTFSISPNSRMIVCWQFKLLNAFLTQCDYCVGKWDILDIIDEHVNNKTRILLQYWTFHIRNVDEAWSLLDWNAWDLFEFERACHIYGYSFHNPCAFYARSYYAPLWCDTCNSSDRNITSCLIMHVMLNLTLHHSGTVLMLS